MLSIVQVLIFAIESRGCIPRTFVVFFWDCRWIPLVFFLGSADSPRVELSFPPGRRNNALDPWGVVCGDVIGYKMEIVRWCSFLEDFLEESFWKNHWVGDETHQIEKEIKHFSRLWRFSNSFIFTPHLGGWSNLTVRILFFKWVEMKPPTSINMTQSECIGST